VAATAKVPGLLLCQLGAKTPQSPPTAALEMANVRETQQMPGLSQTSEMVLVAACSDFHLDLLMRHILSFIHTSAAPL
jgi:hypothetical protein